MYNKHSNPMLVNCTFVNNVADDYCGGGGMFNEYSNPTLINCIFIGNTAEYYGGGMINFLSNPILTDCMFRDNFSPYRGGGIHNDHGSFRPILTNCTFTRNHSGRDGGAIYNFSQCSPKITKCTFNNNSAGKNGGAMANCYGNSPALSNCIFTGNSAGEDGGGIYNYGDYPSAATQLTNCTFGTNFATNGNAIACDSYYQKYPSNLQITNCIFWDGENGIWNNDNSTIIIAYSDIQGGWPSDGNIDADPCFVEPGYWDANGVWRDGDYHLLPDSPCIDAGDPLYRAGRNETDLDGKPRVLDGNNDRISVVDMGAYEYNPLISVRIIPRTINLASESNWITAILRLDKDYNGGDIESNSVLLEGKIEPQWLRIDEEKQVVIATFSREEVQAILSVGEIELVITGQMTDGTVFEAIGIIKVLNKGGGKSPKQPDR
jgi:hypothetical protein